MFSNFKKQILLPVRYFNLSAIRNKKPSGSLLLKTCFLLIVSFPVITLSQAWDLRKNLDDVRVYTRDYPGSGFKEIKAEIFVKSTLAGVTKLFDDVTLYTKWIYACKTAYVLKKISST